MPAIAIEEKPMTAVKLICPTGQDRVIADLDLDVAHGAVVDVPAELAGRPPRPATGDPGADGYDPADLGEGLLAQAAVWEPVTTPQAKAAKTRAEKAEQEGDAR